MSELTEERRRYLLAYYGLCPDSNDHLQTAREIFLAQPAARKATPAADCPPCDGKGYWF